MRCDGPACSGRRTAATTVTVVNTTALVALIVGLTTASVGLLSPIITYRYVWKMDHERWVRERRADAYVRLTTHVLLFTQAVDDLPDDVPDIGDYLRARIPYKDPYGQKTGQLIIAFGTPEMVRLMLSFADIQGELLQLSEARDQVPSLQRKLGQIYNEMNDVSVRDVQRK
jgi:hypothetical protein